MISKEIIRKVVREFLIDNDVKIKKEFNVMHSGDDGKFSDGSDDGSCSDGKRQQIRKGKKCGSSSADCGRKGVKWCRNNKKRTRSGVIKQDELDHDSDTIRYLRAMIKNEIEQTIEKVLTQYKNDRTKCSNKDILNYLNRYELASKGKLYAKKK